MRPENDPPDLMRGEVIGRSVVKAVVTIAFLTLAFLFCFFLVWKGFSGDAPLRGVATPTGVSRGALIAGLLLLVATPILVGFIVYQLLARHRLALGRDRFQLVARHRGQDVVLNEIPYANVAEVKYQKNAGFQQIGFRLKDLDDPDTYCRYGRKSHERQEQAAGW